MVLVVAVLVGGLIFTESGDESRSTSIELSTDLHRNTGPMESVFVMSSVLSGRLALPYGVFAEASFGAAAVGTDELRAYAGNGTVGGGIETAFGDLDLMIGLAVVLPFTTRGDYWAEVSHRATATGRGGWDGWRWAPQVYPAPLL